MERGIRQTMRQGRPPVVMMYFHPWEFDPEQQRLPLRRLNRFRTYVGLSRSRARLSRLLDRHTFQRAVDVADELDSGPTLPAFWDPFYIPAGSVEGVPHLDDGPR
jgi:hypothetical protein